MELGPKIMSNLIHKRPVLHQQRHRFIY